MGFCLCTIMQTNNQGVFSSSVNDIFYPPGFVFCSAPVRVRSLSTLVSGLRFKCQNDCCSDLLVTWSKKSPKGQNNTFTHRTSRGQRKGHRELDKNVTSLEVKKKKKSLTMVDTTASHFHLWRENYGMWHWETTVPDVQNRVCGGDGGNKRRWTPEFQKKKKNTTAYQAG